MYVSQYGVSFYPPLEVERLLTVSRHLETELTRAISLLGDKYTGSPVKKVPGQRCSKIDMEVGDRVAFNVAMNRILTGRSVSTKFWFC